MPVTTKVDRLHWSSSKLLARPPACLEIALPFLKMAWQPGYSKKNGLSLRSQRLPPLILGIALLLILRLAAFATFL